MVEYSIDDGVAVVSLDDGKVNALNSAIIDRLQETLDTAQRDAVGAVVLTGRAGVLSSGFDLQEVRAGLAQREALRLKFVDLLVRLFEFPTPFVVACSGHALAAGAALLLTADRRIGLDGPYKLGFNEAAIGVPMSGVTVEIARYRMPMPWFESLISGQTFAPEQATAAGLLDVTTADDAQLAATALDAAQQLARLDVAVFGEMKRLARVEASTRVRSERDLLRAKKL